METEIGTLLTPVQYAKSIGVPPQQIYSLIKRGLPTHKRILKDKERDLVEPGEATAWMADYEQVKGVRRTAEQVITSNDATSPANPNLVRRDATGYIKEGQLLTYERMPGNVTVGKVKGVNEHYANVEKNCYEMPFILGKTKKRTFPLMAKHVREYIRNRSMVLDCPLQVLGYAIEQLKHANEEMAADLEAVITKYEPVLAPIVDPVDEYVAATLELVDPDEVIEDDGEGEQGVDSDDTSTDRA